MKNNYLPVAVCLCLIVFQVNIAFSQIQFPDCTSEPSSLCVQDEGVRLPANNKFILGEADPNATSCSVHVSQKTRVQAQCGSSIQYQVELITTEGTTHVLKPPTVISLDSALEAELTFDSELSPDQLIRSNGVSYTTGCHQYHTVRWIVTDSCNTGICERQMRFYDCFEPVHNIIDYLQTITFPIGQRHLFVSDFILDVNDDCSVDEEFLYSFSPESYAPDSLFHLCDFPNWGVEHLQDIWIADKGEDLNCDGMIEWNERRIDKEQIMLVIVDPGFIDCWTENIVTISGKIKTENDIELGGVHVQLISDFHPYPTYITQGDGEYVFQVDPPDSTINIIPERLDNARNGVSTLDIVQIMKHLLTKDTLDSPYKLIAADANNSSHVSAVDLVELRKLILGVYTELPHNKSWRFVPENFDFPDPFNPWSGNFAVFAEDSTYDGSQSAVYNFTGIKIGDVNGTVSGFNSIDIRQSNKPLKLSTPDKYFGPDEIVEINLAAEKSFLMQGFQFTVSSDELEFLEASSDMIDFGDDCYALFGDKMTFSWFDVEGIAISDKDVILTIKARAKKSGRFSESLRINSDITEAEVYDIDGEIYLPSLEISNDANDIKVFPNPWNEETNISFQLTESGKVLLEIFDLNGRVIYQEEKNYAKGNVVIEVNAQQVPGNGLYIYSIKTDGFSQSGKMFVEE